jgi:hypothetical protein
MKVDETLKFAWSYLLINGVQTNGRWSVYGGHWEGLESGNRYLDYDEKVKQMDDIREKALSIGIDWEKSGVPEVESQYEFDSTDEPSQQCLGTLGRLVLLNGEKFLIGSADDDAAHLAETARAIINKKESRVEKLAKKLK